MPFASWKDQEADNLYTRDLIEQLERIQTESMDRPIEPYEYEDCLAYFKKDQKTALLLKRFIQCLDIPEPYRRFEETDRLLKLIKRQFGITGN